jgi:hypothetical protein
MVLNILFFSYCSNSATFLRDAHCAAIAAPLCVCGATTTYLEGGSERACAEQARTSSCTQ